MNAFALLKHHKLGIITPISFFALIFSAELISILILNNGVFTYVIDDPYIRMALAENVAQGHYGVNQEEASAPSSSIL